MNLLPEVHGTWPQDRENMIRTIKVFLGLDPDEQTLFRVGRRLGLFNGLADLKNHGRRQLAEQNLHQLGIDSENCDDFLDEMVRRFV
jgi:hypothetical protein